MKLTTGTKASIGLGLTCGAIYIFALIFRATIYPDIYISPTDPYGVADIMELFLFAILIFLMLVSVLVAIILLIKGESQSKKSAVFLIFWCLLIFISYSPLHKIAASWH